MNNNHSPEELTRLTIGGDGMQLIQNSIVDRLLCRRLPMQLHELCEKPTDAWTIESALMMLEGKGVVQSSLDAAGNKVWSLL